MQEYQNKAFKTQDLNQVLTLDNDTTCASRLWPQLVMYLTVKKISDSVTSLTNRNSYKQRQTVTRLSPFRNRDVQ